MRKKIIILPFLLPLFLLSCGDKEEKGKNAQSSGPLMVQGFVALPQQGGGELLLTGQIMAGEEVELRAEVAGRVVRIGFSEGAAVSKGQLLVKINDQELQAQLQQLRLDQKLAEEKEARREKLFKAGGMSQEEYDEARNVLADVRARIATLEAQVAKTEIRAPFSGTIGLREVSEGSFVNAGALIASLQSNDPYKLEFSVPERYAPGVRKGEKVSFIPEGGRDTLQATIYAYDPKIDEASRSLRIRAICENAKEGLLPGAFAKVRLKLAQDASVLPVPAEAVIQDLGGQKVFIGKNGKATPVKVEIANRSALMADVVSGLQAGDTVIVTGIQQLRPGAVVKITAVRNSDMK